MKHLKVFEDFSAQNPYSSKKLAELLRIYAQASILVKNVTTLKIVDGFYAFKVSSNIPNDTHEGEKQFLIQISEKNPGNCIVNTIENGKTVSSVALEPFNENGIYDILVNYIEALNLFDDASVDYIVKSFDKIKSPRDIHAIIRTLG